MGIFDKEPEKTDFDRIGVNVVRPYKHQGQWVFERDGNRYHMAPAGMTDAVLSPTVVGADRLINAACTVKGIEPDSGFNLLFSENFFPGCDVRFDYRETRFDGWVYDVQGVNMVVMQGQQAWVCPYLSFYYKEPPASIYLKVEASPK